VAFASQLNSSIPSNARRHLSGGRSRPHHEVDIPVPSLSQALLDRCNLVVDGVLSGQEPVMDKHLQAIGKKVKLWRIQSEYTRAALAKRLGMNPDQLLFLETGVGMPEDVTLSQLLRLQALLTESDQGRDFDQQVQEYVVMRCGHSDLAAS